jgi:hypothetical protein
MSKPTGKPTNKNYKLKKDIAPLSYMLPSKHSNRKSLLYFDEKEGVNRALRYSANQKTPFQDEQDKNVILEPIIFEDGFLAVPKTNPVLQWFLDIHPGKGKIFIEVDKEADASVRLAKMDIEYDAMVAAKNLGAEELDRIGRLVLNRDVTKISSAELRRDIRVYASNSPIEFLKLIDDPETEYVSNVALMFDRGILGYREGKHVHYNLDGNKKRMLTVPHGEDRNTVVSDYLKSDAGLGELEMLEKLLED